MDLTIQMRSIDLMLKFMKNDLSGVPEYGYTLQKPPVNQLRPALHPFERCKPEAVGLSSAAVERLFRGLNADLSLGMHSVMLLRHGKVAAEGYWAPHQPEIPHMLYSMSKSIAGLAVGMAVDEGLLSIDEKISDIFPELPPSKYMRGVTIRHLLTMSTGNRFDEMGSMVDGDWARMFMESTPKFEPGTAFEYNSLNSYMLAAILRRRTGVSLTEYLTPRLYEPLHIDEHPWEVCPQGIEKGGWGLSLRLEDSAKIGQLFLQRGSWEGEQLISEAWLAAATSKQIETPKAESKEGYGFQVWTNRNGSYQFNGAFGQYVIVLPEHDAVVAIYSGSPCLFAQSPIMTLLQECFTPAAPGDAALPDAPYSYQSLCGYLAELNCSPPIPAENVAINASSFNAIQKTLAGSEYILESNIGGLFPQTLQAVHGNYTHGIHMAAFSQGNSCLNITLYEGQERNTISIPSDGGFAYQSVAMRGERHLTATRGMWHIEDGQIHFVVFCVFLETPNTRILSLTIQDDDLDITFLETPSVSQASSMLFELLGYSEITFFKYLRPAMRHIPGMAATSLSDMIRRFTVPEAKGRRICSNEDLLGDTLRFALPSTSGRRPAYLGSAPQEDTLS